MKKPLEITTVSGAPVAGQEGPITYTLADGKRYYDLMIKSVAGAGQRMADVIGDITLLLGNKPNFLLNGQELDELNGLYNPVAHGVQNDIPGAQSILHLLFAQWYRKQYGAQEAYALDVPLGLDVQLQIKIKTGALAPTLALRGEVEELSSIVPERYNFASGTTIPQLVKVFRRNVLINSASLDFNDFRRKDRIQLIRFYNPTGASITDIQIIKDGELIYKRTKAENDADLIKHDMNPAADIFDFVPDKTDNPADWLNLNGSGQFDIRINTDVAPSANATVKVISQAWGLPE